MQVAVCCSDEKELRQVCALVNEIFAGEAREDVAAAFPSEEALWQAFRPGLFLGAVVGYGDARGFLCARRLREEDSGCRVILLDDTARYAIRGIRIHLSDFLVRPIAEERLRAALERLLSD